MLTFFGRADVDHLIARGKYQKALRALESMMEEQPGDVHLLQKRAHVLVLTGDVGPAVDILEKLLRDYASDGFYAKAIALGKKIQRIDPDRSGIDELLAELTARPSPDETSLPLTSPDAFELSPAPSPPVEPKSESPEPESELPQSLGEIGEEEEEADSIQLVLHGIKLQSEPVPAEDDDPEEEITIEEISDFPDAESDLFRNSPLFSQINEHELPTLIRGLRLRTFEAGEILIAEGEMGSSLLVIASGAVRVYVRNEHGHPIQIRQMQAGEFFGEISLVTGLPRTATVTAAEPCEILELSRTTLQKISRENPRVGEVVSEFCRLRSGSPEEHAARGAGESPL